MSINRPRSAQINDLKQHYTVLPGVVTGSEVTLTDLPSKTVTQVFGGAVEASPAVIIFPNPGPYSLVPGNEFNIFLPGVNGDVPITVQIQGSDIVFSKVTAAKLVARINAVISPYLGHSIASVTFGRVKITSYNLGGLTLGAASQVRISCTTNLFEYFGYAAGITTVTEYGADANTRGIITKSASGRGGQVLFKASNSLPGRGSNSNTVTYDPTVPDKVLAGYGSRSTEFTDVWRYSKYTISSVDFDRYFVDPGDGGEITGFITPVSLNSVRLNTNRVGQLKPKIYTSSSSPSTFNTLTTGDNFTVTFTNSVTDSPYAYTYTFTSSPVSVSDLITTVNNDFVSSNGSYAQIYTGRSGTYLIPDGSFTIKFGPTGSLIEVPFKHPSGVSDRSASALANTINQWISYFAPGQGVASVASVPANKVNGTPAYDAVIIRSSSTDHVNTYVEIGAGRTVFPLTPPFVAQAGTYLGVLDSIGIKPGFYGAGYLLEPYGLDEVAFVSHAREPGSSIKITGNPTTLSRLGILANSESFSTQGEEPVVASESFIMIPEIMTLGEVPVAADRVYSSFQNRGKQDPVPAFEGVKNVANNPGANPSVNKIEGNGSFLDSLALGSLTLGVNHTGSVAELARPRTVGLTNAGLGWTCLYVARSVDSNTLKIRIYVDQQQNLYLTLNCYIEGSTWYKDTSGTAFRTKVPVNGPIFEFNITDSAWSESGWQKWVDFGDPTSFDAFLNIESTVDNGLVFRTLVSSIFSTLSSTGGLQRVNSVTTGVDTSHLRTFVFGSGFILSFNADISYSSSIYNVAKDLAGPSWVLKIESGSDATNSGISLYYDATPSLTLVLTDFTEVFSSNSSRHKFGAPIRFFDDLVSSGASLISHQVPSPSYPNINFTNFISSDGNNSFLTKYSLSSNKIKYEGYNINTDLSPTNPLDLVNSPAFYKSHQTASSTLIETYYARVTSPSPTYVFLSQLNLHSATGYQLSNYYYTDRLVAYSGSYRIKDASLYYKNDTINQCEFADFIMLDPGAKFTPDTSTSTPVRVRTLNDGGQGTEGLWYNANRTSAAFVEHLEGTRVLKRTGDGGYADDTAWKRAADFDLSTALAFRLGMTVSYDGSSLSFSIYNKYNAYSPSLFGSKIAFRVGNEADLDLSYWLSIPAVPFTPNFSLERGQVNGNNVIFMHTIDTYDLSTNSIVIRTHYQDLTAGGGWTQLYYNSPPGPLNVPFTVLAFGLKPNV